MKKLFKVALVAVFMLATAGFAKAQTKIGYIDFNGVIEAMPDLKPIQAQIQAYQKTFIDQSQSMQTELQSKGAAYEKNSKTMTDAARTAAENELQDLQKRIQDFNNNAQQQVQAKSSELFKPVSDKAKAAITAVAKEKGYTYVLDTQSTGLIVSPPGDDLMPAVKLKLGLK
ncbi:OmpH family outer membrane protein [Mucilaginibacter terrae]|uniref:Outer membrane protein n=1 Tax=Mucilaginibacter terrae TaxID=1955052 RepID=A0ABU3GYJ2_9SPHI|nr:OmpH family outer membrane protein [Mucilaginibacter terrae]MDT3404829.1 outer membrane protein [Mucilaginibacter terrae]